MLGLLPGSLNICSGQAKSSGYNGFHEYRPSEAGIDSASGTRGRRFAAGIVHALSESAEAHGQTPTRRARSGARRSVGRGSGGLPRIVPKVAGVSARSEDAVLPVAA